MIRSDFTGKSHLSSFCCIFKKKNNCGPCRLGRFGSQTQNISKRQSWRLHRIYRALRCCCFTYCCRPNITKKECIGGPIVLSIGWYYSQSTSTYWRLLCCRAVTLAGPLEDDTTSETDQVRAVGKFRYDGNWSYVCAAPALCFILKERLIVLMLSLTPFILCY